MGVLLGIAPGITAMQLNAVVASRWFVARRGLVLGLVATASFLLVRKRAAAQA
jgi:hypothetical protein